MKNMDTPIATQIFRQLFRHASPGCQRRAQRIRQCVHYSRGQQARSYAGRASIDRGMKTNETRWQQRTHLFPDDRQAEFEKYPYISAQELRTRKQRPRRVKMLLRDFIEGTPTG